MKDLAAKGTRMLERKDLLSLEDYAESRDKFRTQVLAHKEHRRVQLGDHVQLIFENEMTIKYQIQEMLRIEKVFEVAGIQDELDAYNPLIPDGDNWKCSMLIQYSDAEERKVRLTELLKIENRCRVKIGDGEKNFAIADEDLERANDDKTSAVHFLRFQLSGSDVECIRGGAAIVFGVDHEKYDTEEVTVLKETRAALVADLADA